MIKQDFIDATQSKILNLHIAYLPWNRGADPNIWSHLENTPKGVTIHQIDSGIDTGPILAQKEIKLSDSLTLRESYDLLNREIQNLFWDLWPQVEDFFKNRRAQLGAGSFHALKDRIHFQALLQEKGWDTPISSLKNLNLKRSLS